MEYVVAVALIAIGAYFYQTNKRKNAEVKAILAETKGQDIQLEKKEIEVKKEIDEIDARIKQLQEDRQQTEEEVRKLDELSLAERAKRSRERFMRKK